MGAIGVQVWVYHGEVLPGQKAPQPQLEGSSPARTVPAATTVMIGAQVMLVPKRVKHRKVQRGSMKGRAKGGTRLNHGTWGIQALEAHWITNRQIEAARIAMTRCMKRGGKVWITIFPDKPITKKPAETRMGSG